MSETLRMAIDETKVAVLHSMFNSLIVAVISCVTSVYIATLTAYGLYAYNFRLKKAAFVFIMVILNGADTGFCTRFCGNDGCMGN